MERMSETMQDLGYGGQAKSYLLTRSGPSQSPSGSNRSSLPNEPLIEAVRTPEQIMGASHDLIKSVLIGYKKSCQQWEDFRRKYDDATLEILEEIFFECRCNGYFNPHVRHDAVHFDQIVNVKSKDYGKYPLTVAEMRQKYKVIA